MKKKEKGKQVAISPKAYEIMARKAFESKPRQTLREFINVLNNLPKEA